MFSQSVIHNIYFIHNVLAW